jgi:serine/alanine adding enzyme
MRIRVVNSLPIEEWRRFVERHPQGNIFHTPEMFQVFERTKNHKPELWAATNGSRTLALLLPVRIALMDGFLRRLTTRSVAYGSVLCEPTRMGQAALTELLGAYTRQVDHAPLFTELRNLSDLGAIQPVLGECGFSYEDHMDYLIDLDRTADDVFQGISKSGRKAIRRSKRRGVVAEEVRDRSQLSAHYDLLAESYARSKVPLADPSLFQAVFDVLVPKGMAKMLLARVKDRLVAASLEMPYKDVIYSWFSGYAENARKLYPNDHLVWHILKWGAKKGYRRFDFGGAGRPDEAYGPRDFKAKFGGELVNYGRNTYVHSPIGLALSSAAYQVYIRAMPALLRRGSGSSPGSSNLADV